MTVELIVALDYPDERTALEFADSVGSACDFYKVGMELYTACGPSIVAALRQRGNRVFLDLKYHDIPNTVRGAARNAARLGCDVITVHISGGSAMLEAAVEGAAAGSADSASSACKVFGVSVLTSLDDAALKFAWGRPDPVKSGEEVLRLARLAASSGLNGLVCSAHEVIAVRAALGRQLELLVPGIRLESAGGKGMGDAHDQARVATPRAAAAAGADYLILGRAVTQTEDPSAVLAQVRQSLA